MNVPRMLDPQTPVRAHAELGPGCMRDLLPVATRGAWSIDHFRVERMSAYDCAHPDRAVRPGDYTALRRGTEPVMSDTDSEIRDLQPLFHHARGRGLLHGLGLGLAVYGCFLRDAVTDLTVVEREPDVLALVGPHLQQAFGARLTLIEGDALTWKPDAHARWDFVWHDIWQNITADNLPEMATLHRRFGRFAGWQGSWCRAECEAAHKNAREQKRRHDLLRLSRRP